MGPGALLPMLPTILAGFSCMAVITIPPSTLHKSVVKLKSTNKVLGLGVNEEA